MNINTARAWFDRNDDKLNDLQNAVSMHSLMQSVLNVEGFPSTEMNELREALNNTERLFCELKQSVITHLENK